MGDEVVYLNDSACQKLAGDHTGIDGREASDEVKILSADIKRD